MLISLSSPPAPLSEEDDGCIQAAANTKEYGVTKGKGAREEEEEGEDGEEEGEDILLLVKPITDKDRLPSSAVSSPTLGPSDRGIEVSFDTGSETELELEPELDQDFAAESSASSASGAEEEEEEGEEESRRSSSISISLGSSLLTPRRKKQSTGWRASYIPIFSPLDTPPIRSYPDNLGKRASAPGLIERNRMDRRDRESWTSGRRALSTSSVNGSRRYLGHRSQLSDDIMRIAGQASRERRASTGSKRSSEKGADTHTHTDGRPLYSGPNSPCMSSSDHHPSGLLEQSPFQQSHRQEGEDSFSTFAFLPRGRIVSGLTDFSTGSTDNTGYPELDDSLTTGTTTATVAKTETEDPFDAIATVVPDSDSISLGLVAHHHNVSSLTLKPGISPIVNEQRRDTPSPVESEDSAYLLTTPHDHDHIPSPTPSVSLCSSKGVYIPSFGSFPSPPPREARRPSTTITTTASPCPSLLPSLPITLLSHNQSAVNHTHTLEEEPMSLDDTGRWRSHCEQDQPYPPAYAYGKTPSVPSSTRTTSTKSGIPIETPPTSSGFSQASGRRISKFTAFSGSSSNSSLYSSDSDSLRDRERTHRVTEHPDISTVFEEEGSLELELDRRPVHKPSQSTLVSSHINNRPAQRTHRTGTVSSAHSGRSNKSVHPFAAPIHRAPSPPSSTPTFISSQSTSQSHLTSSRSQPNISHSARMQHILAPAHQVTLREEEGGEDEEKCPICVESLSFTYRLPGEKPHVVPECGHALHEECFVTVYGEVPSHGSKRNIGLCGVCRQKMRIVEGGGERKRSKGKKLEMLMGAPSSTPPLRSIPSYPSFSSMPSPGPPADPNGDDPVDTPPTSNSSRSFLSETQTRVVVPTISIRSEFPSITRRQQKPSTAMITIEVPHAGDRGKYPASRIIESLRSPSVDISSPRLPPSPHSSGSLEYATPSSSGFTPAGNPFAPVQAELRHRVMDYKNSGLENLGPLRLYDMIAVRKGSMLREFLMYLYNDALICISEEKPNAFQKIFSSGSSMRSSDSKTTSASHSGNKGPLKLRGRIYVKHIKKLVDSSLPGELSLTILMVDEGMESFILTFKEKGSHETWKATLQKVVDETKLPPPSAGGGNNANKIAKLMGSGAPPPAPRSAKATTPGMPSSSSMGFGPTFSDCDSPSSPAFSTRREPSAGDMINVAPLGPVHTPLDLVIVLAIPATAPGAPLPLKLRLMRQSLAFVLALLGAKDRVSIVCCEMGTSVRRTPLLNPTRYNSRRRLEEFVEVLGAGQSLGDDSEVHTQADEKADVVTAMNVGLDVVLQRKNKNALTGMIIISDISDTSKRAQMDLVTARLDTANIPVHSIGYGKSHDPGPLWTVSNHTQGTYTFVREWYHLRDTLAGVVGGLMTIALTNMKLHLSAQENEFRIVKVTGTPSVITSASGKSLDIELKELRFGETREILVEVELMGEGSPRHSADSDGIPREGLLRPGPGSSFRRSPSLISGMDNMSVKDSNSALRDMVYEETMVDEVPVIEVDCSYNDPSVGRTVSRLAHPILLTLAIVPTNPTSPQPNPPSDPTVQRRKMELIAADMLTRALLLISRRNYPQAHKLLSETRRIVHTIAEGIRSHAPSGPARTKKEIAAVQAIQQLDAVVGDMDALCEGLEESPELFIRDGKNFASQQGIVLRCQKSWTSRTGSERHYCTDDVRRIIQLSGEWTVKG